VRSEEGKETDSEDEHFEDALENLKINEASQTVSVAA
jgi:hypothetical protein